MHGSPQPGAGYRCRAGKLIATTLTGKVNAHTKTSFANVQRTNELFNQITK